jgi:hypothetical protein
MHLEVEADEGHRIRGGTRMSQVNVERVIGLLATDEAFRRRFKEDPQATLRTLIERGTALTPCEYHALASLDPRRLERFAGGLDPRLQKSDLRAEQP